MRLLTSIYTIAAALLCITNCQTIPNEQEVVDAKDHIDNLINNNIINTDEKRMIAGFVRLAFHDCVGAGGCDGCIDHNNPSNGGLRLYTDKLDPVYDQHVTGKMSRADFYMLAGYVALHHASEGQTDQFTAVPRFGRRDCSTSPNEDVTGSFPSATWNMPKVQTFFADNFQFTTEETVVILGAHTLGRCRLDNSGFEGRWVRGNAANGSPQSDVLNNEYYRQIGGNWAQVQTSSGKFQWQRPNQPVANTNFEDLRNPKAQPNMFLNVDMAIAYDLEDNSVLNEITGEVKCKVVFAANQCAIEPIDQCCVRAATNTGSRIQGNNIFQKYVSSNTEFVTMFSSTFIKMTEVREDETLEVAASSMDAFRDDESDDEGEGKDDGDGEGGDESDEVNDETKEEVKKVVEDVIEELFNHI